MYMYAYVSPKVNRQARTGFNFSTGKLNITRAQLVRTWAMFLYNFTIFIMISKLYKPNINYDSNIKGYKNKKCIENFYSFLQWRYGW